MPRLRILVVDNHAVARALADAGCEVVLADAGASAAMIAAMADQEAVDAVAVGDAREVRGLLDADVVVSENVLADLPSLRTRS